MPLQATCTCLAVIEVDDALAGREVRCPSCFSVVRVNPGGVVARVSPPPPPPPVPSRRSGSNFPLAIVIVMAVLGIGRALMRASDSSRNLNDRQRENCRRELAVTAQAIWAGTAPLKDGPYQGACGTAWDLRRGPEGWTLRCPKHATSIVVPKRPERPAEAPPK